MIKEIVSCVKDIGNFSRKSNKREDVSYENYLESLDVESMYTRIPNA